MMLHLREMAIELWRLSNILQASGQEGEVATVCRIKECESCQPCPDCGGSGYEPKSPWHPDRMKHGKAIPCPTCKERE